jgi:metacaspase-1
MPEDHTWDERGGVTMVTGMSLHIGLNAVDPKQYHGWDGQLRACEQDARDMEALASKLGYRTSVLMTKDATSKKVIAAIENAAATLQAGDAFLLTYSGHGGQVPDRNGDESKQDTDETGEWPDRYDETWVLYDRMLIDDELWDLWSRFAAKTRITMLSDSCHSGTVAKPFTIGEAAAPPDLGRRIPLDVEEATYRDHKRKYDRIQDEVPTRSASSIAATVSLISGCMDNQTSADGRVNGRFTGRLLQVWDEGRFRGSLAKLHKAILAGMPSDQTPNLYVVGANAKTISKKQALAI